MKVFASMIGALLSSILWSAAQVSVEVVLDQEQFLLDESLPIRVRITNRSGQPLKLGQESDWLTFTIESRDGFVVSSLDEVSIEGEQTVESSMVASRRVDLLPYYDLSRPGRYTVTAKVKIKQWHDEIVSKPKAFEISRGTTIWEQEFGVPIANGVPEARKYALQQAGYLKRMTLYVKLTDLTEHKIFKVFPAGPLVSFSHPEAQIDRASDLHLLFQTGARSFFYQVISPEGEVLTRQTYEYASTRPVLRSSEDGKTSVVGGMRRVAANDLPAPSAASSTNDLQKPNP